MELTTCNYYAYKKLLCICYKKFNFNTRIKHISDFYIQFCIIVCRMSETNCHIDCEKQTQFLHVKLFVKKRYNYTLNYFVVIHNYTL